MTENMFTVPGCPEASKPGGSCDYCGTSIRYEFHILSADGHKHKVGCDCIAKVGDTGLRKQIEPEVRAFKRAQALAKARVVAAELDRLVFDNQDRLAALPHPLGYSDRTTGKALSMLDWARWMGNNCGASGKAAVLRKLKKDLI